MAVVSDTSPLSNLAIIDRLGLLREAFGTIHIPTAVDTELNRLPNPKALSRIHAAIAENWICVTPLVNPITEDLRADLGSGEAAALALALQMKAQLILLDESEARKKAKRLALAYTGILGVLREAKQRVRIKFLRNEIKRLRSEARFFVHPSLEKELLMSVGEQ